MSDEFPIVLDNHVIYIFRFDGFWHYGVHQYMRFSDVGRIAIGLNWAQLQKEILMEHLKVESDGIHMLALWKDEQIGYTDEPGEPAMLMHGLIDLEEDEDAFQGEEADELRAAWPSILASLREQGYEPYEDD